MRKSIIYLLCAFSFLSCEKIWVEDLLEQAYDTIRGEYEIESIVWEEQDPIDIDGDGVASFDYLSEWNRIYSGSPCYNAVTNERGQLGIPYVKLMFDNYQEDIVDTQLTRWSEGYYFGVKAVVEENTSHLEFTLPDDGAEFIHSGYGEITLRTTVTLKTIDQSNKGKDVSGTIRIKYVRTKYWCK